MAKNTMANKLPRKLIQKMEIVGEQIKLARLRRNLSKPTIAVKAEDDKSLAELSAIAFDEIKKTGCEPTNFILMITFRQDDELMMMEMAEFNDCLSTYIDNNTDFKWGVQSISDMPYKRRITIIGFTKD